MKLACVISTQLSRGGGGQSLSPYVAERKLVSNTCTSINPFSDDEDTLKSED